MTGNIKSNLFSVKFLYPDNHNIMRKHQAYKKWVMENLYFLPFNLLLEVDMEWNHNWVPDNFLNTVLLMTTSKNRNLARGVFKIGSLCTY